MTDATPGFDPQVMALPVAQAIHAEATAAKELWADLADDEKADFLAIALAAIKAHSAWLAEAGFRILPPGTMPMPKNEHEASGMIIEGRRYLEAHPPKAKLIIPRAKLQRLNS